jgi:hypothetical protein
MVEMASTVDVGWRMRSRVFGVDFGWVSGKLRCWMGCLLFFSSCGATALWKGFRSIICWWVVGLT